MRLFELVFLNALRHKLRSFLTVLGVAFAVLAFGVIRTMITAWYAGAEAAKPDRLVTRNKVSLVFSLPIAYQPKIEQVPGVVTVAPGNWFGGIYKEEKNFFPQFGVKMEPWFRMYREYVVPPDQWKDVLAERNACVVGRKLAQRFGWKLGQTVPIKGTIFPGDYEFVVRGIYSGRDPGTDETQFFFHWDYLNEAIEKLYPGNGNRAGFFVVQIADPANGAAVIQTVDAMFENSLAETLTETEKAFQLGFVAMSSTIIAGIHLASVLIIGVVLLVLANTMAMAARERVKEYAVLKTLGFRGWHLASVIGGESMLLAVVGGTIGLVALLPLIATLEKQMADFFPSLPIDPLTFVHGVGISLAVGVAAAIVPARGAAKVSIVEGLRRIA
jgi:putative ABC transport system permease protein